MGTLIDLPFLGQIASQGLLSTLLALSLFVNWYLYKTIQNINDKRIEDAKEITGKILEPLQQIKSNGDLLIALLQKVVTNDK